MQRSAFTLEQLMAWEEFVARSAEAVDALVGGHVLLCVYSQSRWGDTMSLEYPPTADVEGDGPGVVETVAKHSKGQRGLKRLRLSTPLWLRVRTSNLGTTPSLPAIHAEGFMGCAFSSNSATVWIRATMAKLGYPETENRSLGTHSCKATLQSWLSRGGMSASARRALGHHLKPGDRVGVVYYTVYSRDHIIGPLGGVVRM
eukprot:3770984-Amphidinium_carterae.1